MTKSLGDVQSRDQHLIVLSIRLLHQEPGPNAGASSSQAAVVLRSVTGSEERRNAMKYLKNQRTGRFSKMEELQRKPTQKGIKRNTSTQGGLTIIDRGRANTSICETHGAIFFLPLSIQSKK